MWVTSVSTQLAHGQKAGYGGQGSARVAVRVRVTRDAVAAAETGWCCADEEAPPAQALRELLSPGVGMLGPGGQGGPAPGSCLLRRQVACLDLLPQWALSLHGGHRA